MDLVTTTMQEFAGNLHGLLERKLLSLMLFGSAVLGDYTPGKGDLDFLVAVQDDLSADDCARIFALHERMRTGEMGIAAAQLEGTYYPPAIIRDPKHAVAHGCYVGTGRKGWRRVDACQNSLMDYAILRQYGVVSAGRDIRHLFYRPSRGELLAEIKQHLAGSMAAAEACCSLDHALALFHWGTRALCYARTGQLLSKTTAASWYASAFPEERWTRLVLHARQYRYPLTSTEREAINPALTEELHGFLCYLDGLLLQTENT